MAEQWRDGDLGEFTDPKTGQTMTVMHLRGQFYRTNEGGMADLGGGFYKNQQGQLFRRGPQGGFPRTGGPSDKALGEASDRAKVLNTTMGLIDQFDKGVRQVQTGPMGFLSNGNDLATVKGISDQLLLNLKELYKLGVLNGGDERILRDVMSNPANLRDGAVFQKTIYPRLQNIAAEIGRSYRGETQSLRNTGGIPEHAMNGLYRAPDSQYTPDQWGTEGSVAPNLFRGQAGPYLPKNQRPKAPAPQQGGSQVRYLGPE